MTCVEMDPTFPLFFHNKPGTACCFAQGEVVLVALAVLLDARGGVTAELNVFAHDGGSRRARCTNGASGYSDRTVTHAPGAHTQLVSEQ